MIETLEASLEQRLVDFVYLENRLLDERRFAEWYDLFDEDGLYWIPTQPGQVDRDGQASIALEGKLLLKLRIERLGHPRAFSLRPQVRSMHVVQRPEIMVVDYETNLHRVSCNLAYFEHQAGNQLVLGACVSYTLREVDNRLRIVEKKIELLNMDAFLPAIQLFI